MARSISGGEATPICAISQPRLATMAQIRCATKPAESLIAVSFPPPSISRAATASSMLASPPGAIMAVMRFPTSPVRSIATVRAGSRPSRTTAPVQSSPTGATTIGLAPSSAAITLAPASRNSLASRSFASGSTTVSAGAAPVM